MRIRFALLALACLLIAPAVADAAVVSSKSTGSQASLEDYWTPERMRSAEPLGLETVDPGDIEAQTGDPSKAEPARKKRGRIATLVKEPSSKPNRAHGKLFFVRGGRNFVCSGTVVGSPTRATVWTAGHCLKAGGKKGKFSKKVIFVPAYDEGRRPFGLWRAKKLFTDKRWAKRRDLSFDFAAAKMRKRNGKRIANVVGGRPIKFNYNPPRRITALGYPAQPNSSTGQNFRGNREWRCATRKQGRSDVGAGKPTIKIGCSMTGGTSGGGWLAPDGKLIAVSSFVRNPTGNRTLFGAYMGSVAKKLWQRAGRRR